MQSSYWKLGLESRLVVWEAPPPGTAPSPNNLSSEGLTREDWLNDFQCPSGEFLIDYLDEAL